jgi:hypothetical protein
MMLTESALCERFLYNPYVNPETNRPINRDSKTFLELTEKCSKYRKYRQPEIYTVPEDTMIKEYCSGISDSSTKEQVKTLMKKKFKKIFDQQNLGRASFDPKGTRYCHEFVPADLEMECSSGRRTIVALDFIKKDESPLLQDYKFCDVSYGDSIKYYIKYVPIAYDTTVPIVDFSNLARVLNSNCNAMVIHLDIRQGSTSDDLVFFEVASKTINKYFAVVEIPKTMYFFSNTSVVDELSFPNVFELRVINVQSPRETKYGTIGYSEDEVDYLPYIVFDDKDNETTLLSSSNRLSCQWWFKRFFSTVFECGKGRLVQFAGTCYLTAGFNIIILGEYLKRIIIRSMNSVVEKNLLSSADLAYIREPIEEGICVNLRKLSSQTERILYYSKIFHNTICKTTHMARINPAKQDLFKDASDSYFSERLEEKDKEKGGYTFGFLFKLLTDFRVNFLVADKNFNLYDPYSARSEEAYELMRIGYILKGTRILDRKHDYGSLVREHPDNYPDLILYSSNESGYVPISAVKDLNFVPETSHISISILNTVSDESEGHAICGFMCDGYYKLYDSAYNTIDNWDWTQGDFSKSPYWERRSTEKSQIIRMYIGSCIFVNYNRRLKYFNEGSMCIV